MKMPKWILLVFLVVAACHDDDDNKEKETVAKMESKFEYTPLACPKDYEEIYNSSNSKYSILPEGSTKVRTLWFPEPENPKQKEHWVEVQEIGHPYEEIDHRDGKAPRGQIKALADGQVDISGLMSVVGNQGAIELFIGDKKEPIKVFNKSNSKLIRDESKHSKDPMINIQLYEIHASALIKAGEKIIFKTSSSDIDGTLTKVRICQNKPKEDKKSDQTGAGDQATKQDKSQAQNPPNQGGGSDPNTQDKKNDKSAGG